MAFIQQFCATAPLLLAYNHGERQHFGRFMRIAVENDNFDAVKAAVSTGLTAYNDRFLPKERARTPFAIALRDEDGAILGGMTGDYRLNYLYIDLFWLDESVRGTGQGRKLIEQAEAFARSVGADHLILWTWSFQAPAFYEALGFHEIGRAKNHPTGHDTIHYRKDIA